MSGAFKSSVLAELAWRGRIEQVTHEELDERLAEGPVTLYCGFDPSSDSLTAGHLVPLMGLAFFHRHGHRPIALAGGATGRIGDPTGKSAERNLLSLEEIEANVAAISVQLRRILERSLELHPESLGERAGAHENLAFANNADWILPWSYIDFLREVGKHFRVNTMMAKDSVRTRLENREQGISYTEFSYQLIQAYDFYHLFTHSDCALQIGGSDQWGNITAGIDYIRRRVGKAAYGLTFPLLMTASGQKMGKTEKGAVWLDAERTSPFEWYQYWMQREDADVVKLLRTFTFLSRERIDEIGARVEAGDNRGEAQAVLAEELTRLVHGADETKKAIAASQVLFGGAIEALTDRDLAIIFKDVPSVTLSRDRLEAGIPSLDLLVDGGACTSKGEARRLIQQGGAYLNNHRLELDATVDARSLASETMLVLRSGKKSYRLVRFA
jgi:tyrosyl-tRNA synthetase